MTTRTIVNVRTGQVTAVLLTPAEVAELRSRPAEPALRPRFVPLEFLDLFTEAEQLAVVQATLSNAAVKLWYDRVLAATYITLDDPRVETGLAALTAAGLLSEERKLAVLAAMEAE